MVQLRRDQTAAIAITFALVLPLLLGFMSLGYDVAKWYLDRDRLQAATDAAAMELALEGTTNLPDAQLMTAAKREMARNGFDDSTGVTIVVHRPPTTGPNTSNPNAVELITSMPATSVFGFFYMTDAFTISTRVVAGAQTTTPSDPYPCILALTDQAIVGNSGVSVNVNMPGCSIVSNVPPVLMYGTTYQPSISLQNTGLINVINLHTVGLISKGTATVQNSQPNEEYGKSIGDPYSGKTFPDPYPALSCPSTSPLPTHENYSDNITPTPSTAENPLVIGSDDITDATKNVHVGVSMGSIHYGVIYPGLFCGGLSINGSGGSGPVTPYHITFMPGIYVVRPYPVTSWGPDNPAIPLPLWIANSVITGDGVTFIAETGVQIQVNDVFNLTPTTSGDYKNILFYAKDAQQHADSGEYFISYGNSEMTGDVYAPLRRVYTSGSINAQNSHCTKLIGSAVGVGYDPSAINSVFNSSCTNPGTTTTTPTGPKGLLE